METGSCHDASTFVMVKFLVIELNIKHGYNTFIITWLKSLSADDEIMFLRTSKNPGIIIKNTDKTFIKSVANILYYLRAKVELY